MIDFGDLVATLISRRNLDGVKNLALKVPGVKMHLPLADRLRASIGRLTTGSCGAYGPGKTFGPPTI